MKKTVGLVVALSVILIVGLLILLSYYLINHTLMKKTSVKASLVINNLEKECSDIFIARSERYVSAIIPFSAIQDDINAFLSWEEDDFVTIKCNGISYCLDLKETKLLINETRDLWVYIIAPGTQGNVICEKMGDDIVFDDVTLSSLLSFMGIEMKTNINLNERVVSIVFQSSIDE
ncbi:MAG: hypothetical protein K6G89_06115 [Clostridia bacterium]|nr:hypothetical protein [Clostridia bacterium]